MKNDQHILQTLPVAQPISLQELPEAARGSDGRALPLHTNPLHAIRVRLRAVVGQVEVTLGDLTRACEGQVYSLDAGIDDPVDLLLEGKVVARGQLVALDGSFAVRITELPTPLAV